MKKSMSIYSKVSLLFLIMFAWTNICKSQNLGYPLDLNNLILFNVYQKDSIIAKIGQPSSYNSYSTEFGLSEEYTYGNSLLVFTKNGMFTGFILKDTTFTIYSVYISGGIRVGDPLSKFQQLGFGRVEIENQGTYLFYDNPKCALPIVIDHLNGIIKRILLY
jgi:hypothetical protein